MANAPGKLRLISNQQHEPSTAELVLAARAGSRDATRALYERTADMAIGLAFRLLGNDHEIDDLVQDAYISAFTGLHNLLEPQAFPSWIASIVVRTVQKRLTKRKRRQTLGLVRTLEVDPDLMVGQGTPPDVGAEIRRLYRAVALLPPEERVAIVLRHVEGCSIDEIATAMDLSVSTVKRRLNAAEEMLRSLRKEANDG
jgi:RNA polymerase sigma-70 factor, ECF subfamily